MKLTSMPVHIQSFVADLLGRGFAVWLIGSQANPTGKPPADWDFMVFGNEALMDELSSQQPISNVDPLIVFDGDAFKSPWPRASDGVIKSGSLTKWNWQHISEDSASYEGTKWPHDWGSTKHAIRLRA